MPIASPRYPFTRENLTGAPEDPGVYALYEADELIYVGRAELPSNIRLRLLEHFFALLHPSKATHYAWEICRHPRTRQEQLIQEFERAHFRRPRYNRGPTSQRRAAAG